MSVYHCCICRLSEARRERAGQPNPGGCVGPAILETGDRRTNERERSGRTCCKTSSIHPWNARKKVPRERWWWRRRRRPALPAIDRLLFLLFFFPANKRVMQLADRCTTDETDETKLGSWMDAGYKTEGATPASSKKERRRSLCFVFWKKK